MILLLDNYDSFTYNLVDFIGQCGQECQVIQNDDPTLLTTDIALYDKVLLSPGPGTPDTSNLLLPFISKYQDKIPILGVCLGHQALGQFFGLSIEKAIKPMHGKVTTIEHNGSELFNGIPTTFDVCRYHSLVVSGETEAIELTAFTPEGEAMALRHKTLPIHGVQFHPEAILTEYGLQLIKNWIELGE